VGIVATGLGLFLRPRSPKAAKSVVAYSAFFLAKPNLYEPTMRQAFFAKSTQSKGINMIIAKQPRLLVSPKALLQVTKHLDIAPQRKILRTVSTRNFVVQDELEKVRRAWKGYQSTRRRGAIYGYLSEVFTTVRRWKQQDNVKTKVHQVLRAIGNCTGIRNQNPYAVVILSSSDPRTVDTKTRSKWVRALRYAEEFKPDAESLGNFIKKRGGINEVAARCSKCVSSPENKTLHRVSP
jgi:hypothetical protein